MAHILRFSIDGLAGRKKRLAFELNRDANVFWGLNGAGKTSLLKILHAALANDSAAVARLPFTGAEVDIYSVHHDAIIRRTFHRKETANQEIEEITANLIDKLNWRDVEDELSRQQRILAELGSSWSTEVVSGTIDRGLNRLRHGYLPISRVAESRSRVSDSRTGSEGLSDAMFDAMFAKQVSRTWDRYTARATSKVREVQQQGIAEILSVLFGGADHDVTPHSHTEIDADSAYTLVTDFLKAQRLKVNFNKQSFRKRYRDQRELSAIVSRIAEITAEVQEAFKPQEKFRNLISEFYSGGKSLDLSATGLTVTISDTKIPLESLSSGEKQLMQILLEVMDGDFNSVIIDEPELSMHVDWQNRLVESMQTVNPEAQLILATHSPEVMANLSDRVVFEL